MEGGKSTTTTYSHAELVNPLLKGCLTGQLQAFYYYTGRSILHRLLSNYHHHHHHHLLRLLNQFPNKMLLKRDLLCLSITATASLGTFEILTKKLRNGNGGKPLTLYQEACCGLISGSSAILLRIPFEVALNRVTLNNLTYTNWLTTLHQIIQNQGLSAFWTADYGFRTSGRIAAYVGMLASYDRSRSYFIETQRLPKSSAEICSSIVAGFFSAACAHPFPYAALMANEVKTGKIDRTRIASRIACYLNPFGGSNFYTAFLARFRHSTAFCMVQYAILEQVRELEWIK